MPSETLLYVGAVFLAGVLLGQSVFGSGRPRPRLARGLMAFALALMPAARLVPAMVGPVFRIVMVSLFVGALAALWSTRAEETSPNRT